MKRPGPKKKLPIRQEELQGFKYLDSFFKSWPLCMTKATIGTGNFTMTNIWL